MKIRIQITTSSDEGGNEVNAEVARLERANLQADTLGLSLAESRLILAELQQVLVDRQVAEFVEQQKQCSRCGSEQTFKGQHQIVYRTPFGKMTLPSPRFYSCQCHGAGPKSRSPLAELLRDRTSPELMYLETKFAALLSYGVSVDLLKEVLPISQDLSTTAIRNQVQRAGERLEAEMGEEREVFIEGRQSDKEDISEPLAPMIVGIDGGYVHACNAKSLKEGWFEVIVGKITASEEKDFKCFSFVSRYDTKPKRRLYEALQSQGMQLNQTVTFLSDGGDTVRDLQKYLSPLSEHFLDWFHITMRITVMRQMAKSLKPKTGRDSSSAVDGELERIKWNLWHGNVHKTLEIIRGLACDLDGEEEYPEQKKLRKALGEFETYLDNNRGYIPNYGDRYRHNEPISTSFVESAVNQVVSKRFVKKQQMRWTERGAHLLLQIRTKVLDEDWREKVADWYPAMANGAESQSLAA